MQSQTEFTGETEEKATGYAWCALALLMIVYILNFLDRTIIYILFPGLKKKRRSVTRSPCYSRALRIFSCAEVFFEAVKIYEISFNR